MRSAIVAILSTVLFTACGGEDDAARKTATPSPKASTVACTPAKGDKLAVRAKWRAGDSRTVKIVKSRTQAGKGNEATSTARLDVLGPRRLRWTTEDLALPEGLGLPDDDRERLEKEVGRFVVEYSVDRHGAYEQLKNVDEVRAQMERMVDVIADSIGDDAKARKAIEGMRAVMLSDAFLQATATEDVAIVHGAYGLELTEGKPLRGPYELPNPFGGDPLPARATMKLESVDPAGCARLSIEVRPDAAALTQAIEAGLAGAGQGGADLPEAKMVNTLDFTYDPGSGWMTQVDAKKVITIGRVERVDRTILTLAEG